MKLAELILEHDLQLRAESALKTVDWAFDVDPFQAKRFDRGAKAMKEAEHSVAVLYKVKPDKATELWAKYCPYAIDGHVPASVLAQ